MTSFYPAIAGRSSTQLSTTRLLFQIHNDELSIQNLQTQLSTGRRIEKPSQDPAAAIRALAAQRQLEYKDQTDDNLASANVILSASESTLSQAQNIINEMRGIAVQATGTTISQEEAEAFSAQIQTALQKLSELGNSKFRDQFVFGGSRVLETPFQYAGDTVRFNGNNSELSTISDYSSTIAANVTANEAFGVRSDEVFGRNDLNPSIELDTPLSTLNRGDGIRRGSISISNGIEVVEFDLSSAHDIQDVVRTLESKQVGGRDLQVNLTTNGLTISYADGLPGLMRIDEVGSGNMAADLGIANAGTAGLSPIVGSDLNPIVTPTTKLSQLFGRTGITIGNSFLIQQGDRSYTISTNGLTNVEDLISRIHRSGAQVEAGIDASGRYLTLQSTESGSTLSIGENGSNLASRLGIRTFDRATSLSSLNFGQGITLNDSGPDLVLTRANGTELSIDLDGVQNVGDVIDRINNNVDNFSPSLRIVASLATVGNGIVLTAPNAGAPIRVENAGGSEAAWGLGLVPLDATNSSGNIVGTNSVIAGSDVSGVEVQGVFTSLIRLRQAVETGRVEDMTRIAAALDADVQRMSLARGFVGARQQNIEDMLSLSSEQQVQLKEIESNELDADLAEVISELSSRQAALQASLQLMGQTARQSLFDYL